MKQILVLYSSVCFLACALSAGIVTADPVQVQSAQKDQTGVIIKLQAGLLRLEVCDDRTIHVTYSPTDKPSEKTDFVVNRQWTPAPFEWREEPAKLILRTARMGVEVDRATGMLTFVDADGKTLLQEPPDGGRTITEINPAAAEAAGQDRMYRVQQTFLSPSDEYLYGMAQCQDGVWNWRGMPIELRQLNTQAALPVLVSSRGYGLLWDNASLTDFNPVDQEIQLSSSGGAAPATGPTATEQLRGRVGGRGGTASVRDGAFTTGEAGEYVFFAKDGDRRNEIGIVVNGQNIAHIKNMWAPYTAAGKISLPAHSECAVQLLGGGRNARLFARPLGNTTTFRSRNANGIDYYFFYGPEFDDIVAAYRNATGAAPLWPKWAYGFWQCRERYSSQQQILDTVAEFRKRRIPIDLIVQDWQYWGNHGWGAYEWDTPKYPDPEKMIQSLHEQHVRFMISVWSNPQGKVGADLKSRKYVIPGTDWVDAFNPAARELRWKHLNDAFFKIGADAWWQDATEPGDDGNSMANRRVFLGSGDLYRNAYPLFANQTVYEGQRAASPDKRVVILTRSAYPGQQRYATALWSGDIGGNWDAFRRQIPAGLHVCLTGLPYWTTDCGGFFRPRDQYKSEDYADLLIRWFQFSTFCPVQRIHGFQSETEFWKFPGAQETLVEYDRLRYRLLPYIYSQAWRVTHDGYTMMRALPMDFRGDPNVYDICDQYMFGPAFLVNPVTQPKAVSRGVYLPAPAAWTNFWTGESSTGGERMEAPAPRQTIPLFIRAGSVIPLGPDLQYADEKPADPIEIRVYPGANGSFTLYEDEGDGYRYENGAYATISFTWDDAAKTLTIGPRKGEFPGMLKERTFHVVWVSAGHGAGIAPTDRPDVVVQYKGDAVTIPRSVKLNLPVADGPFQPSAESLKQYQYPDWFRDAKFGIWAHWGPQAVPMDGDWYARGMYEPGNKHYKYHLEHYGHPSEFGYKDIIALWKAEKWDPDRLMSLYKKAGAKYFVSMGSHHDNFFLWNSKLHRWNSVQMGPQRDVVGEWQKAAQKYGLKFGVSEHLGASFTWFQSSHRSDKDGPKAGVPYDGANPQYQDLYHFPAEPNDRGWYSKNPRWQQQWYDEIKELVDEYHPDLLYTDGAVPFGNAAGYSMIAHLYNDSAARNNGRVQVVYTCKQKSQGRWVEDLERGVMSKIDPYPWQTDTSIGDWFYNRNWKFRPVSWVIYMLVDNVSKNGNLLLNVVQRPDGSLDPEVEQMLEQLAEWNAIHGEGIFGTRPWLVYGESTVNVRGGSFREDFKYNAKEIRFTTKGSMLYAYTLGWPEDRKITIRSLAKPAGSNVNNIEQISLLGYDGMIEWQQTAEALTVTLPEKKVSEYTAALKITGSALTNVPYGASADSASPAGAASPTGPTPPAGSPSPASPAAPPAAAISKPVSVASPNGKIKVDIQTDAAGQLTWSVRRQDQPVLSPAPLGLTVDGRNLGQSVTLGKPRNRSIDDQYPTWGNHSLAINRCNEAVIPVTCADGMKYELDVRAFDDGVGSRIRVALDDTMHSIAGESTSWALPPDSRAWWARYDGSYEQPCRSGTLDSIPERSPLAPPITFKIGESLYIALTEANNDSFPDMGLVREGGLFKAVFPASSKGWSQQGPIVTPWRVAIVADGLNALVNSDILTNLCPPPPAELASADWIKPGRALWHWWSIGAPKLDDQKEWVDAAKKLGFEYYLIDEGWRGWRAPGKDQWQCLKEVIDYAKTRGIGCLVWVDSKEMRSDAARRAYLEKVASLGAAGIKIDFIPACTSQITRWYEGALKDTAELRLLCNFHGAVKPTGRRRTWPHEFTREAVRGHEYHMTRYRRIQAADHDETVLFTRFLAGPADYTPTAFDPRELAGYTWAHLLAQAVDMTSPLLHFAGKYQDFIGNPAEDLLRHLPSTWDETIVLPGSEIGKTVGFARRSGQEWYIGVLNGGKAAELQIDLSFLGQGDWQAEVFGDVPDEPTAFKRESKAITAGDKLTAAMSPRGGAVVWIKKSAAPSAAQADSAKPPFAAPLKWKSTDILIKPVSDETHDLVSVKDPTVVRYDGKWHVYATTANKRGSWSMVYLSFADWADAANVKPFYIDNNPNLRGYHCAPQVFYFRPHKKWYLIYQSQPPQYSTADDISKPETWTKPQSFFKTQPAGAARLWIDFWVICDDTHAYLFSTGDDGKLYRSRTKIDDFPKGMSDPEIAIQGPRNDVFEGGMTYKIKGTKNYLTLIEAIGPARYYRAWTSDRLDGKWTQVPNANTWQKPFAGINNVAFDDGVKPWTKDISHGELIRDGYDETPTIDPDNLQLLYQGRDPAINGRYDQLPYRLGLLKLDNSNKSSQ